MATMADIHHTTDGTVKKIDDPKNPDKKTPPLNEPITTPVTGGAFTMKNMVWIGLGAAVLVFVLWYFMKKK